MTCFRYFLAAVVLTAPACGGSVNSVGDGTGSGGIAGGTGGAVSGGGTGGTAAAGGSVGGSTGSGGSAGSGGAGGTGGNGGAAATDGSVGGSSGSGGSAGSGGNDSGSDGSDGGRPNAGGDGDAASGCETGCATEPDSSDCGASQRPAVGDLAGVLDGDRICQVPLESAAPVCPATLEQARCETTHVMQVGDVTHARLSYTRCTYNAAGQLIGLWTLAAKSCGLVGQVAIRAGVSLPDNGTPMSSDAGVQPQEDSYGRCFDTATWGSYWACAPTFEAALCGYSDCRTPYFWWGASFCAGAIQLTSGSGLGGHRCYYDQASHNLIGVSEYGDLPEFCNGTAWEGREGRIPIECDYMYYGTSLVNRHEICAFGATTPDLSGLGLRCADAGADTGTD